MGYCHVAMGLKIGYDGNEVGKEHLEITSIPVLEDSYHLGCVKDLFRTVRELPTVPTDLFPRAGGFCKIVPSFIVLPLVAQVPCNIA